MKGKDKIYEQLVKMINNEYFNGVTAAELERHLDVKRSVISHYLNILFNEGKLKKTTTRPVRYYLPEKNLCNKDKSKKYNVFSKLIGFNGSLKSQVEQCKCAVVYPPKGLPIIINGSSGVGKSYLASLIYEYAVDKGIISQSAPFVELNCADYANNPELLSSVLFGYVEGAFTGAAKEKKGLMDEADGGYLFLDEIHRLSFENQEKLFIYLDKGKFRRLGENELWHSVNVRLIFATTEDIQKTLLETFYRRIPLKITLPDFHKRPLIEKMSLIYNFYKHEAENLNMDIEISEQVLDLLSLTAIKGNIGMLRNYIKLSCAKAYKNQMGNDYLIITAKDMPNEIYKDKHDSILKRNNKSIFIKKDNPINIQEDQFFNIDDFNIDNLISSCLNESNKHFKENIKIFIKKLNRIVSKIYNIDFNTIENENYIDQISENIFHKLKYEISQISDRYGVIFNEETKRNIFIVLIYTMYGHFENVEINDIKNLIHRMKKTDLKAFLLSEKLIKNLQKYYNENYDVLLLFISVIISDIFKTNIKIHAIIAAHGDSTASSIASVANRICNTYIFEPFDMPITDDSRAVVEKVNNYIKEIDTSSGLILLVDMGSLLQMYEQIKNNIDGELLIINNVTTYIALDIGFKILRGYTIHEIIEESKNIIQTEVRYYEGITQGDNIIISCISGIGIAQKLKDIFEKFVKDKNLEVVTIEYNKLKDIIQSNLLFLSKKTKLIITTNNIQTSLIPSVNIEDIISKDGYKIFASTLGDILSLEEFKLISEELVKFFSKEGISNHLNFLNPNIIINEVENVINQYEQYYNISLENHLRLNLYVHIAIMIERLMINNKNDFNEQIQLSDLQKEFIEVTENAFHSITEKYNIKIPLSEILLIYEIIIPEIYKD